MADWPDEDELKQVLDITSDEWDTTVTRVLAAAIATVKSEVGHWEDDEEPDERLAQAALRMAELMSIRPLADVTTLRRDPTYRTLMTSHRRVFGFA